MSPDQLIERLKATMNQTMAFFELEESKLDLRYGPDKWTVRELLHHLADAETVMYERIRRTISKPGQLLWGFAQDDWAEKLEYDQFPLIINKHVYHSVRQAIIYLAEKHYETSPGLSYTHSRTGTRTLAEAFEKVAWHNQMHLDHIQQALDS